MFKINDYIMYGTTGICKVIDIVEEKDRNFIKKEYYVLNHIYENNTIIKIPTDNTKIFMRKILSKEEVEGMLENEKLSELIWIDSERQRNESFKALVKTGDFSNLVKLVRSITAKKKEKIALGKKLTQSDEIIMKNSEKLLFEELSIIFDFNEKEAHKYILNL